MTIADDITEALQPTGKPCKYARILAQLDATDRDAIEAADLTASEIARILTRHDHPVGDSAIRRHRHGDCTCP